MDFNHLLSQEYFHNSVQTYLVAVAAFLIFFPLFSILHSRLLASIKMKKGSSYFALSLLVKVALWSTGVLLILANLGVNISALVASLGIGGIAVALAAQNILMDIFSSVSIHMDKPFEVGDFITVGDTSGTVEKIGLKTTRLRALTGEEVVISNRELTSVRLHNHKKMQRRQLAFSLMIEPQTPSQKLRLIPEIIKKVAKEIKGMELNQVYLKSLATSGLEYEVAYSIAVKDTEKLPELQNKLNLGIVEALGEEGVGMVFKLSNP